MNFVLLLIIVSNKNITSTCHPERSRSFGRRSKANSSKTEARSADGISYDFWIAFVRKDNIKSLFALRNDFSRDSSLRSRMTREKSGCESRQRVILSGVEDELRERSEPMRVQVSEGNAEISYDFWIAF